MIWPTLRRMLLTGAWLLPLLGICSPAPAQQPARGYIDARWNSGYVLRNPGHHACGYFAVCQGCSCLVPRQYRAFAPIVVPGPANQRIGGSWYMGDFAGLVELPTGAIEIPQLHDARAYREADE